MACDLSILVPVFNEEDNILPLAEEVAHALRNEVRSYELVFVDDASTDGTWVKIQEARRRDRRVRGLRHKRNCGQSAALWTGLQATVSPIIATMDGDLQNDPADLPKLLKELEEYDFVCGVRTKRKDDFVRRASSNVARKARKLMLGVDFRDTGCAFRVFKRAVLKDVFPFNGLHRFLPVLVHGAGRSTREIPINHRPRVAGVSKYGLWNRLGRGILDLCAMAWYQQRRVSGVSFEELPDESQQEK
ncbi:MAG: glycosyltransferase [Pedosphaera sp.]|nr:glycosyltransferase [Pedosphaera sp.]